MKIRIHADANAFLERTLPVLMRDEALHNLPIGIAMSLRGVVATGPSAPFLCTLDAGEELAGFALMTPPYPIHVYAEIGREALAFELIRRVLLGAELVVPGVIAIRSLAERFAAEWQAETGIGWRVERLLRVFRFTEALPCHCVPGDLEKATRGDEAVIQGWVSAFREETGDARVVSADAAQIRSMIAKGSVYLWRDATGNPVSCACALREIPSGKVINLVYTPPELRNRGYASACVRALSVRLMKEGAAFCCLFADQANPAANRVYERIGYRPLSEYLAAQFEI